MSKALSVSAAVFAIIVFTVVAPAGVLQAQEGVAVREGVPVQEGLPVREGVPEQAGAAPGEGVAVKAAPEEVVPAEADPQELTDEEIRQLLIKESIGRFKKWKRKRGYGSSRECSDYNGVQGPAKPKYVFCEPADVPAEQVELYRESQRQLRSTFITEPKIKF